MFLQAVTITSEIEGSVRNMQSSEERLKPIRRFYPGKDEERRTRRVGFRMQPSLHLRVQEAAEGIGMTVSEFIDRALEKEVNEMYLRERVNENTVIITCPRCREAIHCRRDKLL